MEKKSGGGKEREKEKNNKERRALGMRLRHMTSQGVRVEVRSEKQRKGKSPEAIGRCDHSRKAS